MTAATVAVHALADAVLFQCGPIGPAGVLGAPVRVDDGSPQGRIGRRRTVQRPHTQLRPHAAIHGQTEDSEIKAVKDGGDIQPAVLCLPFGDVGDALFQRLFCGKVPFQQVIRLSGLPVRPGDAIEPASRMVDQADFFHHLVDRPLAGDVHALRLLEQQRLMHPLAPVGVVTDILIMYFSHGIRQSLILPRPLPSGEIPISVKLKMQGHYIAGEEPLQVAKRPSPGGRGLRQYQYRAVQPC